MALTRNPDAVSIFADAAIYLARSATPTIPADIDTDFDATWDNLGILDGDNGVKNSREWDTTEHFGWGIGLYRKGFKNYKESKVWTCRESNKATRRIARPGSTATAIRVGRPLNAILGFEYVNDFGRIERLITARPATCWIKDIDTNESDPRSYEITADIFARGDGLLYTRQYTPVNEVQSVVVTGTGGTFKLGYLSTPTGTIAYNAAASAVQAALVAILGTGNVTVTGTAGDYEVTLTGDFAGEENALLTADAALLTGPGAGVEIELAA